MPGARADDQAEQDLAADVGDERVLHPRDQRPAAVRRESPVEPRAETLHVEEHVDRDDEDEHAVEERLADRDRGAFDEVHDPVGVAADIALAGSA